jgi:hypothetical protein
VAGIDARAAEALKRAKQAKKGNVGIMGRGAGPIALA